MKPPQRKSVHYKSIVLCGSCSLDGGQGGLHSSSSELWNIRYHGASFPRYEFPGEP